MTSTLATSADFLAAICERPADDLPRLKFADWLDENGEPDRAEFIRAQVEIAWCEDELVRIEQRGQAEYPERPNEVRENLAYWRQRETELWHRLPTAATFAPWAPGISTDPDRPRFWIGDQSGPECIVRRGFVSELRGTAAELLGGVCETCCPAGSWTLPAECDECGGTGRTTGLAHQMMRTWEACGRCGGTGWADVGYVTEGVRVRHGRPQDKCKHCTDGRIPRPLPPGCQPVQVCRLTDGVPVPIPTNDDRPVTWQWKNERGDLLYVAHAPPYTHAEWHPTQRVVGRVVCSVLLPEFGPGVEWVDGQ